MGMKRKIKKVSMLVNQLTDPQPELVSFVRHGANQTPFRALKSEETIADFTELELQEQKPMAKNTAKATKSAKTKKQEVKLPKVAEIHKVTFKSENFVDEGAVTEFLEGKGYEDFTVTKTEEGFEVLAKDASKFAGEPEGVEFEDGVTFFVGKLADGGEGLDTAEEDEEDDSEEGDAEKATKSAAVEKVFKLDGSETGAEIVKKYCDCYGCYSTYTPPAGKTIADVLTEQYNSGNFPAFWELSSAFQTALFNLVKEGDTASISTLATEFGNMIVGILDALNSAGVDVSVVKTAFLAEPEKEETMKTTKSADPKVEDAPKIPEGETKPTTEVVTEEVTTEGEGKEVETKSAPAKAEGSTDIAAIIAEAVKSAITPLTEKLEGIEKTVQETKDGLDTVSKSVEDADKRVTEMEQSVTTRKSADVNGPDLSKTEKGEQTEEVKKNDAYRERTLRSSLGIGMR